MNTNPVYRPICKLGKWTLSRNQYTGDYRVRHDDAIEEMKAKREAAKIKWTAATFTPLGSVSGRFSCSHENPSNTPKTRSAFICDKAGKADGGWWCSRLPGHDGPCALRRFADGGLVKPLFYTTPNGVGKSWALSVMERNFRNDICRIFEVPERIVVNTPFGMPYGGDFYSDLAKGLGVSRAEAKTAAYTVAWGIEPKKAKETVNGVFGNCTLCGKPIDDVLFQGHTGFCSPLENNTCTCGGWEQPVCTSCLLFGGTLASKAEEPKKEEEPATYAAVPPTFTGKDWWKSPANEALVTAYWGRYSRFVKEFSRKAQTIRALWVAKGLMTREDFSNWVLANDRALVTPMNTDEKKQLEQMVQYIAKGFISRNDVSDWEERRILKLRNYYRKNPKKECAHTYPCEIHEENDWGVCRCCAQREAEVRRAMDKPIQAGDTLKTKAVYSDNHKSPTAVPWPPKYVHRSVLKYWSKTTKQLESLGKVQTVTVHHDRAALSVCVTPDAFLVRDFQSAYHEQRFVIFSLTTPGVGRYMFPAYIQSVINDFGMEHSFTFNARVRINELTDKPELDFFPV